MYIPGRSTYKDLASDESTTILASSGRSGSTWVGNILQSLPGTRQIFEPFHPKHGIGELARNRYRYIEPGSTQNDLQREFRMLIEGRTRSRWIDQFNGVLTLRYTRRLLKEVRINLLLPWLAHEFPNYRYVLLLRHPAAVVQSQIRGGWALDANRLLSQEIPISQSVREALKDSRYTEPGFASNLVFWALENAVALQLAHQQNTLLLFYEDLCVSPDQELERLSVHLGTPVANTAKRALDRVSWSSRSAVASYSVEQKISGWKETISAHNVQVMREILEICGLDCIYGSEPYPIHRPSKTIGESSTS